MLNQYQNSACIFDIYSLSFRDGTLRVYRSSEVLCKKLDYREKNMKGKIKVKGLTGSGMVLQRNKINCVYGTAESGADLVLEFRGENHAACADGNGCWKVEFNPGEAGGPFVMTVRSGESRIEFSDIFVGEVWLSSGQSNAQLPMERMKFSYPEEMVLPRNDKIRVITVPINWSLDGEKDEIVDVGWQSNADEGTKAEGISPGVKWLCASPETVGSISGLSYFFAKRLSSELDVPVGIINASQGGSPIASWMSRKSLEEMGDKGEYLKRIDEFVDPANAAAKQKDLAEKQSAWNDELYAASTEPDFDSDEGWEDVRIPGNFPVKKAGFFWFKKTISLTAAQVGHFNAHKTWLWMGTIVDADTAFVNGVQVGSTPYCYPPRRYPVPAGTLREGKNLIALRVQKNSSSGPMRFFTEKPYFLFTENAFVDPCVSRNLEVWEDFPCPNDAERIDLSGDWKMKADSQIRDCPEGMFFEWLPTALYNSMLAPCFNQAVSGAVWYQGESDAGHPEEYRGMLLKMIELWRKKFVYAPKDMPFVIVQLPNWSDGWNEDCVSLDGGWANIRQVESDVADKAVNAGLAVTIDAGEWNDLHPEKKKSAGTRAANEALRLAYGKNISPAPKFKSYEFKEDKFLIRFDCGSSSLATFRVNGKCTDLRTESSDKRIFGFSLLCEKDGKKSVREAAAVLIDGNCVEVLASDVDGKILEVRYLWADSPAPVNLYSRELLPVVPFRITV